MPAAVATPAPRAAPASPTTAPPQRHPRRAWRRTLIIWAHRLRRTLGIRRALNVDGFHYKELTAESLPRALSRKGTGHKDYRITFPDGSKQVVRCAAAAPAGQAPSAEDHGPGVYADLMGHLGINRLDPLLPRIRPGSRALELGAGTGYRALWLSYAVGPSGGVVALCTDPAHTRYAQRRYTRGNIAFEHAETFALSGETDGAFDAACALGLDPDDEHLHATLTELWRLIAPNGWLLLGTADPEHADALAAIVAETLNITREDRTADILIRKPS